MTHNIFAYGTLMFPEIVEALTGISTVPKPAIIHGYVRYAVRGQCFPGIIEKENGKVEGVVYSNINDQTLFILDQFESVIYERHPINIETRHGQSLQGFTYVVTKEHYKKLSNQPWDPKQFIKQYSHDYTQKCIELGKIWKTKSQEN